MSYYQAWDNQNSYQASVPFGGRSNGFQQGRNAASQWSSGYGGQGRYYDLDSPGYTYDSKPAAWFRDKNTEIMYNQFTYGATINRPGYNYTKITVLEGGISQGGSGNFYGRNWIKNNGGTWVGSGGTGGGGGVGGNNRNPGQGGFSGGTALTTYGYSDSSWLFSSAGTYGGGGGGGGGGVGFRHINNSQGQTNTYGGGGGGGGAGYGIGGPYGGGQNGGYYHQPGRPGYAYAGGAGGPNDTQGPTPGGDGGQIGQYGRGPPGFDGQGYPGQYTGGGAPGAQTGGYNYINQY